MNTRSSHGKPRVGIIMGSQSDAAMMRAAGSALDTLAIPHEIRVLSAHRDPKRMIAYVAGAKRRGLRVIIAGAGGAAHLPGMAAALTTLPVLGVPVRSHALNGLDSLLSIMQMPTGVPVGTMSVDQAHEAGLMAARILALASPRLARRLKASILARGSTRKRPHRLP